MIRPILISALGAGGAQFISLLVLPVVARHYGPQAVATWALLQATTMLAAPLATLRLENAVPVPRSDRQASRLFWSGILLSTIVALLCGLGGGAEQCRHAVGLPLEVSFGEASMMIGAGVLFTSLLAMLNGWAIRCHLFRGLAATQVTVALVTAVAQVTNCVVRTADFQGLYWGSICGQAVGVCVLVLAVLGCPKPPAVARSMRSLSTAVWAFRRFPLYSVPFALFGAARDRANVLAMQQGTAQAMIGTVAMVQRLTNVPASLISSSLRPVVFAHAAQEGVSGLEPRITALLRTGLLLGTPCLAATFLVSDRLPEMVLGPGWPDGPEVLRILALPAFTFVFSNWMDRLFDVTGKQRLLLTLEVGFSTLAIVLLVTTTHLTGSFLDGLRAYAFATLAYNVATVVIVHRMCHFPLQPLLKAAVVAIAGFWAILIAFEGTAALAYRCGALACVAAIGLACRNTWLRDLRTLRGTAERA